MKRYLLILTCVLVTFSTVACAGTTKSPLFPTSGAPTSALPTLAAAPTGASEPATDIPPLAPADTPTQENTPLPEAFPTQQQPAPTNQPSPTSGVKTQVQPSPTSQVHGLPGATPMTDPQLLKLANDAKADLSTNANLPVASIAVKSVTPQEWTNAALGCPRPGIFYIQVLTQGYIIVLTGGGRDWEYHAGGTRVVLCDR